MKVLIIILIILAVIFGFYMMNKKSNPSVSQAPTSIESGIGSDADLMSASKDLDATDIDGPIDQELGQNDQDSATF